MTSKIHVHVLHTGSVIVDEALPFNYRYNPPFAWTGLFRSKRKQLRLPVSVYLIEHPKGLILIDTGWHDINRTKPIRNLTVQYPINKAVLPKGTAVHEQLEALGFQSSDIDYVILSHLHCDHADGLAHVADAKNILVSETEWHAANSDKIHYLPHQWNNIAIQTFPLKDNGIGPTGKSFDLFGDGTLVFVHTPGHSAGLCTTRVKAHKDDASYLLLASDVGYAEKSWKNGILPGLVINKDDAIKSLNWVKSQALDKNCIKTIANHDAAIQSQIISL